MGTSVGQAGMRSVSAWLAVVIAALLMFLAGPVFAQTVVTPTASAVGHIRFASDGTVLWGPNPAPQPSWMNASIRSTVNYQVAGRTITVPATARAAASAASVIAPWMRLNPAIAIGSAALAAWAASEQLTVEQTANGYEWRKGGDGFLWCYQNTSFCSADALSAANAAVQSLGWASARAAQEPYPCGQTFEALCMPLLQTLPDGREFLTGMVVGERTTGQARPAVESDFAPLAARQTVPDAVLDVADGYITLPIAAIQALPGLYAIPGAAPTTRPDGTVRQPAARVEAIPSSTNGNALITVQDAATEEIADPGVPAEESITCGLPGTPPCKIDETGTPEAQEVSAQAEVEAATEGFSGILAAVTGATGSFVFPEISWSFALPTACGTIPLSGFAPFIESIDVCQFQPIFHDIMSIVWVIGGLFGAIGLFWRDNLST